MTFHGVQQRLLHFASSKRAKTNMWFFKTGPGQYGEGDQFIGVSVPHIRIVAKEFKKLQITEIEKLLKSIVHEERLTAIIILVEQYKKAEDKKEIYDFYLSHTKWINNWDLVDTSAGYIVGEYLYEKKKDILVALAKSGNIWERRISIISTFYFIKKKQYKDTLKIAELLIHDKEDLIHKAVGWMLREVGKNCGLKIEEKFLNKYYKKMPRTMLRYAIEHFSKDRKSFYMQK